MRWRGRKSSSNVEDRRGRRARALKLGGGGSVLVVVVSLLMVAMGKDPSQLLGALGGHESPAAAEPSPADDESARFVRVVLADLETTWNEVLPRQTSVRYEEPTLVLFRDEVRSACGLNSAAVGPFYCPADRKAYLDLTFFEQLSKRHGAPGDFAQAYVIAHEIGHHVQNLLGTSTRVHRARASLSEAEGNQLSVQQELQADCFAGVWAHYAQRRGLLEPGDLEEGLRAAAAIGDDTLQRQAGRRVSPESWTHGSSVARVEWFRRGFGSGALSACDTFGSQPLGS